MAERILVVEDEARIASLISRGLRLEGYQVDVAPNGETALDKAFSAPPDLVILDVMLPDMDGLEVCRQLRAAGAEEPVLMLTAKDAIPDRVAGLDAGADDYLVKPFAFDAHSRPFPPHRPARDERPLTLRRPGAQPCHPPRPARRARHRADRQGV
jgi:CheY-like chemotaxis protein